MIWFIILSIGLVQGIFLIISLFFLTGKRNLPLRLLAFILFCYSLLLFLEWLNYAFDEEKLIFTYRIGETVPLLLGPLIWFYTFSIVKPNFAFSKKDLIHFVPFFVFCILFLPFYLEPNEYKINYIKWRSEGNIPIEIALFSWFKGIHSITYLFLSWLLIIKAINTKTRKPKSVFNLHFLSKLIIFQIILSSIIYISFTLQYFEIPVWIETDLGAAVLIAFSLFLYTFSLFGVPEIIVPIKNTKYSSSTLSKSEKKKILHRLIDVMKEKKPYLNPELTLNDLSDLIDTLPNHLSQVINELNGINFHQFINEYRIKEIKKNINDSSKTLYGIALESGFNSKSAFNRIFKEYTGLTPSQYKKSFKN